MTAKGYWMVRSDVTNPEQYKEYVAAASEATKAYGARYLARGGQSDVVEGSSRSRHVIVEFPDYASALACYHSDAYQAARAKRTSAGVLDIVVIEGVEG
jgi:uncharacterized protein (DUF1330 family)